VNTNHNSTSIVISNRELVSVVISMIVFYTLIFITGIGFLYVIEIGPRQVVKNCVEDDPKLIPWGWFSLFTGFAIVCTAWGVILTILVRIIT
jgi:hypothetical protein